MRRKKIHLADYSIKEGIDKVIESQEIKKCQNSFNAYFFYFYASDYWVITENIFIDYT